MKRHTWIVDTHSERPAGKPGICFYCNAPRGSEHRMGCVIRSRTVVVEVKATLILDVPEDWEVSQIEFHMNESSSCHDNLLDKVIAQAERIGCSCGTVESVFLREATAEDEEEFKMKVADAEA